MLRILVFLVAAVVATLPSALIARIYLRRRQIDVPADQTVSKFMEVAPTPVKAGLITLNFVNFFLLCGGGMFLTTLLDG